MTFADISQYKLRKHCISIKYNRYVNTQCKFVGNRLRWESDENSGKYAAAQPAFTCSKSTLETPEQGVKKLTMKTRKQHVYIANFEHVIARWVK